MDDFETRFLASLNLKESIFSGIGLVHNIFSQTCFGPGELSVYKRLLLIHFYLKTEFEKKYHQKWL